MGCRVALQGNLEPFQGSPRIYHLICVHLGPVLIYVCLLQRDNTVPSQPTKSKGFSPLKTDQMVLSHEALIISFLQEMAVEEFVNAFAELFPQWTPNKPKPWF